MNNSAVKRDNITREFRHGMRGESARRCDYLREVVDYHFALPPEDSYSAFADFDLSGEMAHNAPEKTKEEPRRLGGWD